jgi:hypothetical protein
MPVMTVYEEVENVLTNRLKNALRTGEIINAPNWVSDLAACLALTVTMVEQRDRPGLQAFAHRELDRFITERIMDKEQDDRSRSLSSRQHPNHRHFCRVIFKIRSCNSHVETARLQCEPMGS